MRKCTFLKNLYLKVCWTNYTFPVVSSIESMVSSQRLHFCVIWPPPHLSTCWSESVGLRWGHHPLHTIARDSGWSRSLTGTTPAAPPVRSRIRSCVTKSRRHAPYPVHLHTWHRPGDEHGNLPSPETDLPERGDDESRWRKVWTPGCRCSDRGGLIRRRRSSSFLLHFSGYDMDALKSAGRAIIRSPSIAKQSWGSGKHKSKCSAGPRACSHLAL